MKVAAGKNIAVIDKDERIIRRRARFDGENFLAMGERAANRTMNLRHAAQTVGILHARVILLVRSADLALAQKRAQMTRNSLLPGMRSRLVDARVERGRRALERLKGHGARHIRDSREAFRAPKREPAYGVHRLRAIEECKTFLGLEMGRLQPGLLQRARARQSQISGKTLPLLR